MKDDSIGFIGGNIREFDEFVFINYNFFDNVILINFDFFGGIKSGGNVIFSDKG